MSINQPRPQPAPTCGTAAQPCPPPATARPQNRFGPCCGLLLAACLLPATAGEPAKRPSSAPPSSVPANPQKRLPAVSLLPNDSRLQQVMIPRYDSQRRLLAVLRAGQMKIVDAENVTGQQVNIELHRPEGGLRGVIDLRQAHFDQKTGLLRGQENVAIRSDTLRATGTGVVYELERSRGFLLGPATTLFYPRPPATSMSQPAHPKHVSAALVATLAILPVALPAGPAALGPADIERLDREITPVAMDAAAKDRDLDAQLAVTKKQSDHADTELTSFLRDAALTTLLAEVKAPSQPNPTPPAEEKLDPGPNGTRVLSDGGMFFDTAQGILVYLKNVRLSDPRFDLSCRDELKVFLAKKPEPPKPKAGAANPGDAKPETAKPAATAPPTVTPATAPTSPDPQKPAAQPATKPGTSPNPAGNLLGGDFGDIDRLVATGAVRVVRKGPQGDATIATAETAIYEATSGDVILRGGFPTVRKGKDFLRALEPGLYIRLYANGDVYAQPGKWETGVANLNQKDQPAKPR